MAKSEELSDTNFIMHSFTTERLLIRPLLTKDKDFYCQQLSTKKVMRHTGGTLSTEEANKVFRRSLRANQRAISGGKKLVLTWTIVCLKSETIIGTQTLSFMILPHNADIMHETQITGIKQAEIGIMLSPKANGKLFPEEAMGALMEYAFTQLKILRINAFYSSANLATKRFVNKLGFIESKKFEPLKSNTDDDVNNKKVPSNLQSPSQHIEKTRYQYFHHQQWQQQLIIKVLMPHQIKTKEVKRLPIKHWLQWQSDKSIII